ncbi:MAG TPA: hypothetical protein VD978_10320 [Azospirillum sp.]|nr:hypothetical protein [Azospirillum sp.]
MTSISSAGSSMVRSSVFSPQDLQRIREEFARLNRPSELSPFRTAAQMVEFGEEMLNWLQRGLGGAQGARGKLADEAFFAELERTRGKDFAESARATFERALKDSEGLAETALYHLSRNFTISGDLITVNDKGERVLGQFSLYGRGDDFSVLIDSQKGAFVSTPDGGFTDQFTRITPAQVRNLPYSAALGDNIDFSA